MSNVSDQLGRAQSAFQDSSSYDSPGAEFGLAFDPIALLLGKTSLGKKYMKAVRKSGYYMNKVMSKAAEPMFSLARKNTPGREDGNGLDRALDFGEKKPASVTGMLIGAAAGGSALGGLGGGAAGGGAAGGGAAGGGAAGGGAAGGGAGGGAAGAMSTYGPWASGYVAPASSAGSMGGLGGGLGSMGGLGGLETITVTGTAAGGAGAGTMGALGGGAAGAATQATQPQQSQEQSWRDQMQQQGGGQQQQEQQTVTPYSGRTRQLELDRQKAEEEERRRRVVAALQQGPAAYSPTLAKPV